jgi:hypothetical protein
MARARRRSDFGSGGDWLPHRLVARTAGLSGAQQTADAASDTTRPYPAGPRSSSKLSYRARALTRLRPRPPHEHATEAAAVSQAAATTGRAAATATGPLFHGERAWRWLRATG